MRVIHGKIMDYIKDLEPLFKKHWDEIGMAGTKKLKLDVNIPMYTYMEAMDKFLGIALINENNVLVGYLGFIIYEHPHHKWNRFAMTDVFMIDKEYRKGFSIIKMFRLAEKLLKDRNVSHIQFFYDASNCLDGLATRLGYKLSNIAYIKEF